MTPDEHTTDTINHTRDIPADEADTPSPPAQSDENNADSVPEVVACGAAPQPEPEAHDDAEEQPEAEEEVVSEEVSEEDSFEGEENEEEGEEESSEEVSQEEGDEAFSEEAGEEEASEGESVGAEQPAGQAPAEPDGKKKWYVVKVQSGREDTIKAAIERRVKIEGLEEFFGQIVIPVEYIPEIRKGKRVDKRHKLYPGYLMVEVEFNDRILYLFRETSGVGDFVGGSVNRAPPPMSEQEVQRMVFAHQEKDVKRQAEPAKVKARFSVGDRLRILDGAFSGWEAEVVEILEERARVRLEVSILGRNVPVELEYYQVEPL